MNTPHQPKGQPGGGQFAAKSNPECKTELDEPQPVRTVDRYGTERWYLNGQLHRTDGPAVVYADGTQEWLINGQLHRPDGPAATQPDGYEAWYLNGQRHRLDGPARTWSDGTQEWWVDDEQIPRPADPPLSTES